MIRGVIIERLKCYRLQRFEKTNEMLINCNHLSAKRFQNAARDFKKHTAMLHDDRNTLIVILNWLFKVWIYTILL